MIYLKSIYSEPSGLFDKVVFKNGINMIYGKYSDSNKKGSLNSIGKTTLVHLINFCLLSSYDKKRELYKSKRITDDYYIVLEVEINGEVHIIKRTTSKSSKALYGIKGKVIEEYKIKYLKRLLCNLFFKDEKYNGVYSDKWFRMLMKFFMRDEKTGFKKNPIIYIYYTSELKLVPHNLFLLGLDNSLAVENYNLKEEYKVKNKTKKGVKKAIKSTYGITEIENINAKIANLKDETLEIENHIKLYELDKNYIDLEEEANELTKKIKKLVFKRHSLIDKIEKYNSNLEFDISVSPKKVERIYKEINEELALNVRKTLDEAIEFKRKLISSRERFLKSEIENLKEGSCLIKEEIKKLDQRRGEIFKLLDNKGAINDLTTAINRVNQKKEKINELEGKLKLYNDLENELLSIEKDQAELNIQIKKFIDSVQTEVNNIRKEFNRIYYVLYDRNQEGVFNISYNESKRKDAKISIKATSSDSEGWGKSRGCILVYDLTILFNAIKQNRLFPRFLIHDGIFNGISKNQFVSLINFLNELSKVCKFQYIFTANEGDTWINQDGSNRYNTLNFDLETTVVAQYSENNKLFKRDF